MSASLTLHLLSGLTKIRLLSHPFFFENTLQNYRKYQRKMEHTGIRLLCDNHMTMCLAYWNKSTYRYPSFMCIAYDHVELYSRHIRSLQIAPMGTLEARGPFLAAQLGKKALN